MAEREKMILRDDCFAIPQDEGEWCSGDQCLRSTSLPHPEERAARLEGPHFLKYPAQQWPLRADGSHRPRCYKCEHWRSNMPLTGRCDISVKRGVLSSHDTMPGDECARFELSGNLVMSSRPPRRDREQEEAPNSERGPGSRCCAPVRDDNGEGT